MKTISYIFRGISALLLVVMLQNYLCSTLCIVGVYPCCGAMQEEKDCCYESSGYDNEGKDSGHDNECQKEHLAFFQTIGQFHFLKSTDAVKAFQSLVAVIYPRYIFHPVEISHEILADTGFHPPPRNADIRILIHSFQI